MFTLTGTARRYKASHFSVQRNITTADSPRSVAGEGVTVCYETARKNFLVQGGVIVNGFLY